MAEPQRDRELVRHYWPAELRPAFDALFAIDDALAAIVANSTQPALGAIRLAWWREALERLDTNPPPPEPRLQAVAAELLPRGVSGALLAELEDGWAAQLDEKPDWGRIAERGAKIFEIGARLLGNSDRQLEEAGRLYAYAAACRAGFDPGDQPKEEIRRLSRHRFPKALRPLTALARLAARDIGKAPVQEPEATPGRAAALLSHRLFGFIA
ncbi:squalene/phytoene synthase family protein [Sphingomonas cremea]|uniref:squalene/phytoene synthase family protein n=1 Tax=Sphingomonas cremea TaxID=2904799 RepID=UPI0038B6AB38